MSDNRKLKPYKVYDSTGVLVLQATEDARYSKDIEQCILQHGYTIKLNGKKITKKELRV